MSAVDENGLLRRGSLSSSSESAFDSSSIQILLSMKHASEELNGSEDSNHDQEESSTMPPQTCLLGACLICTRGVPNIVTLSPTWSTIMRVVFYTLKNSYQEKQFFNLRTDVYSFMAVHWEKLCLSKDPSINWKKQIQDMLSHSKNLFESGTEHFKQNGYWRLKPSIDPWTIEKPQRDKARPKSKDKKRHSSSSDSSSEAVATKKVKTAYVDAGVLMEKVQELKTDCDSMCVRMKGIQGEIQSREVKTEDSAVFSKIMNDLGRMQDALKSDAETMRQEITSKFQSNIMHATGVLSSYSTSRKHVPNFDEVSFQAGDMNIISSARLPFGAPDCQQIISSILATPALQAPNVKI